MKMHKGCCDLPKLEVGSDWYTISAGCLRLYPPPVCHLSPCKVTPGELVQSSRMDITLDDVLMILDENYNNMNALDALNQEPFQ